MNQYHLPSRLSVAFSFLFLLFVLPTTGQTVSWEWLSPTPEPVTNQAVSAAQVGDDWFVYSFAGLDTLLSCNSDHLKVFRYDVQTDTWSTLPDIPDALGGKIAPGANTIDGKIYVVGGYHLASNCNEVSSAKTHIFDPENDTFLPDGADIPIAIDDQVQAVWRDSLLYVVTGWSNTGNVPNVQIYKPSSDEWLAGTPVSNNSNWKVFGGSGSIVEDTIYYAGGARSTGSFQATSHFRKGYINPDDPTEITWSGVIEPLALGYRMGATSFNGQPIWIGGADDTYNFDAIAYNGSGVINPLDRIVVYDPENGQLEHLFGLIPAIMDIRGVAELGDGEFIVVGGMLANQEVTSNVLKITIETLTSVDEIGNGSQNSFILSPNPSQGNLRIVFREVISESQKAQIIDVTGKVRFTFELPQGITDYDLSEFGLEAGSYWLKIYSKNQRAGSVQGFQVIAF